jgi:hypothetical protein
MDLEQTVAVPMEWVVCPELGCGAPARVGDRFELLSTDGPVEHVKTWCDNEHGLTPRAVSVRSWPVAQAHRPPRAAGA